MMMQGKIGGIEGGKCHPGGFPFGGLLTGTQEIFALKVTLPSEFPHIRPKESLIVITRTGHQKRECDARDAVRRYASVERIAKLWRVQQVIFR